MTKTFTKSEWEKMVIVANPTTARAMIRADHAGKCWEWVSAGKRVTVRLTTLTT